MRKLGIVVLTLGILLLGAAVSSAKDIYVKSTYTPDSTHATTINGGIALASAVPATPVITDTIHVAPGTYVENVVINKNVRIVSNAGRLVTIIRSTNPAINTVLFVGVSNAVINGFTVSWATNAVGVLIGLGTCRNVKVKNCIIEHNAIGIDVVSGGIATTSDVLIDNNTIRYSTFVNGGTIQGNGIVVLGADADVLNVVITNNQIVDNDGYGIYVFGSSGAPSFNGMRIGSNTLINNGAADFGSPNFHNLDIFAMGFENAAGTITLNNNKIQQLGFIFSPINKIGGTATYVGTGNQTFPSCNKTVGGPGSPLAVP